MIKSLLTALLFLVTLCAYPQANINVVSTNPTNNYIAGETLTFEMIVTNTGNQTATGVNVFYPIPAGITIPPNPMPTGVVKFWWTGSNGSAGTNVNLNNTIATLAPGQSVTYTIHIKIPYEYTDPLPAISNLVVRNTNNQTVYTLGGQSVYTVTVTNKGPNIAPAVNVSNLIPAGITQFSWTGSNGSSGSNTALANTIQNLAVNSTVTYTITLTVPVGYTGSLTSTAGVSGNSFVDPITGCPQCADTDTAPQADIVVVNTNNQNTYTVGAPSVYTVTVTNNGPNPATNVVVQNAVPTGITTFTWTGSNGSSGTGALNNTIPTLASGETVTYTITMLVPATYTANQLVSTASATSPTIDPSPGCPQCVDTDVKPSLAADIVVVNTNNQAVYTPGTTSAYTITVTNNGPNAATNVLVQNPLPTGITTATWTGTNGSTGTGALNNTIATLAVGQTVTYTYTVTIPAAYTGNLVSQASATTPNDPDTSCLQCIDTDGPRTADLVVTNTNNQAVYTPGVATVYTLTVTNNGPYPALNVQVSNPRPTGITLFSWTGSNGSSGTNANLTNTIPSLAVGATVTYTITLTPPANYTLPQLSSVATVTSSTPDPTPECPACTDTDLQSALADLVVTNTNNQDVYVPGTTVQYIVTVTNNGPSAAENVEVTNAIPAGITQFSWTGSNSSSGTNVPLEDTIPSLAAGATITYTITVAIPAGFTGPLVSSADATTDTVESDYSCTQCIDADLTVPSADIVTVKTLASTGTPNTYTAGTNAVYTITVSNQGPLDAVNVAVEDIVPAGIDPATVTWTGDNGTGGTGNLTDDIALLTAGTTITYQVTVPVPANFNQQTDLVNEVTVISDTPDPTPGCEQCAVTATPRPLANITTLKTNGQTTYISNTQVTYTITITNQGPSDAINVRVQDAKPAGIDLMTWEGIGFGAGASGAMNTVIPVLAVGQTVQYSVTVFVPENYHINIGPLQNVVEITSPTEDPFPTCLGCTDTDTPSSNFVTISKDQYTVEELVEDVLIKAKCVNISNIIASAGNINSNNYGLGYFNSNNSDFPLKEGIVLRNGNAEYTEGKYTGNNLSSTGTGGGGTDTQLQNISNAIPGNGFQVMDVTYLQFDFVPLKDNITFDFLFASNEYGTYQCDYSDVFAFILTDLTDGTLVNANLAVIPNTNIPVTVLTIRDGQYNSECASSNVGYFDKFNPDDPAGSSINMIGQTTTLQASSPVIVGNTYRIKMAVGDYRDTLLDAAVFLTGFDLGQPKLLEDFTIANGQALCPNTEYLLEVQLENPDIDYTYEWEQDGVLIVDDNGDPVTTGSILVTEPGVYTVKASFASNPGCEIRDSMRIEYYPDIEAAQGNDLIIFDNGGVNTFDLTQNNPVFVETLPDPLFYEFFFYHSLADIQADEISIQPDTAYPGTNGETIFTKIQGFSSFCYAVRSFELYILNNPESIEACIEAPHNAYSLNLTGQNAAMLASIPNPGDYTITFHESLADAQNDVAIANPSAHIVDATTFVNNTKTYYVKVWNTENPEAFAITPIEVTLSLRPADVDLDPINVCLSEDGDLTPAADQITAASPDVDLILTLHATQADAEDGVAPLSFPVYQTTQTANHIVYIRAIQDGTPDAECYTVLPLEIVMVNCDPLSPDPLHVCEASPYDGIATFDLTVRNAELLASVDPGDYTITFYNSQEDADAGVDFIQQPESYEGTNETIYIRVVNNDIPGNFSTTELELIVTPQPEIQDPADVAVCSEDGYILPVLAVGNYYTGAGATGTMLNAGDLITDSQTIFIYAINGTSPYTCTDQEDFTVTINQTPVADNPDDVAVCDSYILPALVSGNYFTAAGGTGSQLSEGDAITSTQDIYVYAETGTIPNCFNEQVFTVTINNTPVLGTATPLEVCDDNTDGQAVFNMAPAIAQILNGQTNLTATLHTTLANAELGTSPQSLPDFTSTTQTVYVRVIENGTTTNCYAVAEVQLTVNPKPVIPTITTFELCDVNAPGNGIEEFDLTVKNDEITGNDTALTVSYFLNQADASAPVPTGAIANPSTHTNTASPNQQTIWVRVQDANGCFAVSSFIIQVNPLPAVSNAVYNLCEDTNSQAGFNLHSKDAEITQNATGVTVSYFETLLAAQNGTVGEITANPYTSGSKTVYARVENNTTECFAVAELQLVVIEFPTLGTATPVVVCANTNSTNGTFNLTPAINQILNGQTGITPTVHTTLANANLGTAPQSQTAYTGGTQTVYVRLVLNGTNPVCFQVETISLIVNPNPVIPVITPYELCDFNNPGDGVEQFDLTTKNNEITGGDASLTVSYYLNQANASAPVPTGAIANPAAHSNTASPNQQTIWVRVQNTNGCFATRSFIIRVNPLPLIDNTLEPLYSCEESINAGEFDLSQVNALVALGNPNFTVRYYTSQLAANGGGNDNITQNPYTAGAGTVYVRVDDPQTECYATTTLQLIVIPAPVATTPDPLEECDFNNDGVAAFNLDAVIAQITAQLGNVTVTVHETIEDAQFDENPITNTAAYTNVTGFTNNGIQTVFILVQSAQTECFDIVELDLIVRPVPEATTPAPYQLCDDDEDGIAIFDLSTKQAEILGALDPALYTFSYHLEAIDAANGSPSIGNALSYPSGTDTIYVRITDNATGCYDVVELELIVNPLPLANDPVPYTLCDVVTIGDEREVFDLTTKIQEITGGADGVNVTFHTNFNDANLGDNEITNPTTYTNLTTVQTLFVRVTTEVTGCYRIVLLDIRVEPLPVLTMPDPEDLTVCDPDGDGIGIFDLEALVEDMVNNGVGLDVTFHWTAEDAENDLGAITNTTEFQNVTPYEQTIYVRVENTATGCVNNTAFRLDLLVVGSPQMPTLEPIALCDEDNQNQSESTVVDLTQQNAIIYAAEGIGADYIINYFTDLAFAENGSPRITNPTTFLGSNDQIIWVRAEDPVSGCFGITSFTLEIAIPHLLIQPAQYSVCNEELPNDNQAVFDLTTRDNEILGPFGVGQGYTVEYFESQLDMDNNDPITDPETYNNPEEENPKTLFVRVTTLEGCRSYTTLTVKVMPLPTPNINPTPLELCDDNNSPDGIEEFDLTDAEAQIRNNNNTWVLTYYETIEDAEAGTNAIPVPTAYPSGNGTVFVRVETRSGNPNDAICHQVVTLELIVNPLPVLGTAGVIAPFAFCEQNTDGFNQFLLTDHIDEILVGLDPADYTVRFYLDQANMNNNIALPNQYTNQTAFDQTILVRVENNETGCRSVGQVRLLVEEGAIANPVTATELSTCDIEGDNDGIATFDLTPAGIESLGAQSPVDYSIGYYTSEADAQAGINAIADPTVYTNTASPDVFTIWIRITNTTTVSGCFDITSFTTLVEQLPEPVIGTVEPGNTICVDFATGVLISGRELNTNITDPDYSFQWYFNGTAITGATAPTYIAQQEGDYTVVVTSPAPLSCESDMSPVFTVIKSGPATIEGNGYTVSNYFSDEQVVTINVRGFGVYEFKMDNGPWQTSNVFTNVTPGSHEVFVRDTQAVGEGCGTITIGGVSIVNYPKFFTPNGDGYNDTWKIIGLGDQAATSEVYIFDRFGKLLKQISTGGEGWDGTFNGTPMPATDYWFTISYEEEGVQKEFKAHFALKR